MYFNPKTCILILQNTFGRVMTCLFRIRALAPLDMAIILWLARQRHHQSRHGPELSCLDRWRALPLERVHGVHSGSSRGCPSLGNSYSHFLRSFFFCQGSDRNITIQYLRITVIGDDFIWLFLTCFPRYPVQPLCANQGLFTAVWAACTLFCFVCWSTTVACGQELGASLGLEKRYRESGVFCSFVPYVNNNVYGWARIVGINSSATLSLIVYLAIRYQVLSFWWIEWYGWWISMLCVANFFSTDYTIFEKPGLTIKSSNPVWAFDCLRIVSGPTFCGRQTWTKK